MAGCADDETSRRDPQHRPAGGGERGLVVAGGLGLFLLLHHDAQAYAEQLIRHLHLNPAHHSPQVFLALLGGVTDARVHAVALGAAAYAAMRFVEAYGLWRGRRWAEWLAAGSGAIYIPFELYEVGEHPLVLTVGALVVNVLVVGYLLRALARERNKHSGSSALREDRRSL